VETLHGQQAPALGRDREEHTGPERTLSGGLAELSRNGMMPLRAGPADVYLRRIAELCACGFRLAFERYLRP